MTSSRIQPLIKIKGAAILVLVAGCKSVDERIARTEHSKAKACSLAVAYERTADSLYLVYLARQRAAGVTLDSVAVRKAGEKELAITPRDMIVAYHIGCAEATHVLDSLKALKKAGTPH